VPLAKRLLEVGVGRRRWWGLTLALTSLLAACNRVKEILPPGSHAGYYVTADGTPGGDGSDGDPWDLATALDGAGGAILPGDTVWVRGGTYNAPFTSNLTGTASASIIVRAYPGERAIIDGKDVPNNGSEILTVDGAFTIFWGLEITNSATQRTDTRHSGVYLRNAQNVKLVNLIIHDTGMGVFGEPDARGCEVYGSIIYNGGWQTATRSNGHALYMKGDGAGSKIIRNNIMFDMYGLGFHAYADAGTGPLDNMTIEGNIIFNSGTLSDIYTSSNILVGGEDAADNIVIQNNYTYFSPGLGAFNVRLGYQSTANGSLTFSGNYLVGAGPVVEMRFWNSGTVQGNVMSGSGTIVDFRDAGSGYTWTNNTFYRDSTQTAWRFSGTAYTLPGWRAASGGLGTGDRGLGPTGTTSVAVIPNSYEPGRANIVVYNWAGLANAQVNVGGVLSAGDQYEVRNVQALFGSPVASGTYNGGGTISVPMAGVTPTAPIGGSLAGPVQTGPAFNAFLLVKVS
jgi:hypothetical protein